MKINNFLNKLRNQPENVKKIILWSIVSIVAVALLIFWWFFIFQKALNNLNRENLEKSFNIQELKEKINQIK